MFDACWRKDRWAKTEIRAADKAADRTIKAGRAEIKALAAFSAVFSVAGMTMIKTKGKAAKEAAKVKARAKARVKANSGKAKAAVKDKAKDRDRDRDSAVVRVTREEDKTTTGRAAARAKGTCK